MKFITCIILLFCSIGLTAQTIYNPYDGVDFSESYKTMIHMHSTESDGNYDPDVLLEDQTPSSPPTVYGDFDYQILGITDHDTWPDISTLATPPWEWITETPTTYNMNGPDTSSVYYTDLNGYEVLVVRGMELTECGYTEFPHINNYFTSLGFVDCPTNGIDEYIDSIVAKNAIGVFNHPWLTYQEATYYADYFKAYGDNMVGIEINTHGLDYSNQRPRTLWDSINAERPADSLAWGFSSEDYHAGVDRYGSYMLHFIDTVTEAKFRTSMIDGTFVSCNEPNGNGTSAVPVLTNVSISGSTITLTASSCDSVRWFDNTHDSVLTNYSINVADYIETTNFLRAELYNTNGVTYTQPFGVRDTNEMISNGGFVNDAFWTVGTSWSIDGEAIYDSLAVGTIQQLDGDMISSIQANTRYTLRLDNSATSVLGAVSTILIRSTSGETYVAQAGYENRSYIIEFITPADIGDGGIQFYAFTSRPFTLDNISLKENAVVGSQPYYIDPAGDDLFAGTIDNPWKTLRKAVLMVSAGDTVYLRDGVHYEPRTVVLDSSGTDGEPICFFNYPGESVTIDCKNFGDNMVPNTSGDVYGYFLYMERIQFIEFKGLTIRNAWQHDNDDDNYWKSIIGVIHGYLTANLTFENVFLHNHGKKGFYIVSGAYNSWDWSGEWVPGFDYDTTTWLNCDVYDMCDSLSWVVEEGDTIDAAGNSADCWKVENWQGTHYTFTNCRAYYYSDDGFDPNHAGYKIYDNCWAMATRKYAEFASYEGNGFKQTAILADRVYYDSLVDPTDTCFTKYINCIMPFNTHGIYNNLYLSLNDFQFVPNNAVIYNCTAYGNRTGIYDFTRPSDTITETRIRNTLAFGSTNTVCSKPDDVFIAGGVDFNSRESDNNFDYVYDAGSCPRWEYASDIVPTAGDFNNGLDSLLIEAQVKAPRQEDGSLPLVYPFALKRGSPLIDAGTQIPAGDNSGIVLDFNGLAPDVGANESNYSAVTLQPISLEGQIIVIDGKVIIWDQ